MAKESKESKDTKTTKEVAEAKEETKAKEETNPMDVVKALDLIRKTVVIVGHPKAGKTYLSEKMRKWFPYHTFINTDEYNKKFGYEDALYELMKDIELSLMDGKYMIIEGVLGYRLLRKGVERDTFYPDYVIDMSIPESLMEDEYKKSGEEGKIAKVKSFCKQLNTIYSSYQAMNNPCPPEIIAVKNEWVASKKVGRKGK